MATKLVTEPKQDIRKGLIKVRSAIEKKNISPEYKYIAYLYGLFPNKESRCIFNYWKPN